MPGRGPATWRQASCCGGDWQVKQIQIRGVPVGIVGLAEALEQVRGLGYPPGPEAAEELLSMIKTQNYVARGSEEDYGQALLREYSAYYEAQAGPGQQERTRSRVGEEP
jgi:hypothetical protein